MLKNQNIQNSFLFDDSISSIDTSSNNSNVVHNRAVTSTMSNNTKNTIKNFSIYKPQQHNIMVSFV
jgi:hypothetical protein